MYSTRAGSAGGGSDIYKSHTAIIMEKIFSVFSRFIVATVAVRVIFEHFRRGRTSRSSLPPVFCSLRWTAGCRPRNA